MLAVDQSSPTRAEAAPPWTMRQVLRRAMTVALPRRLFLARCPSGRNQVALTFDDGPHPIHTPQVLDALAAHDVRATFFVLGRQCAEHPDLLRRMAAEGHCIAHHSWSHGEPARTSARALMDELCRTQRLFEEVIGRPSKLFRPPHGKLTAGKLLSLWRAGFTVVLWNRDSKDYERNSSEELVEWSRHSPLRSDDMVLMHDVNPRTPEALGQIIRRALENNLRFVTVDEVLEPRHPYATELT